MYKMSIEIYTLIVKSNRCPNAVLFMIDVHVA